jgi:ketosteroid isomerase-like protein
VSDENVQAVRRLVDAFNSGDVDGWVQGLHPDVIWVPIPEYTETGAIRGPDPVREFVLDWVGAWDQYTLEVTRIFDGGDWVVMGGHHEARHSSGAEMSMQMFVAAAYRDGKGVEFRWFTNEVDALSAAGIEDRAIE